MVRSRVETQMRSDYLHALAVGGEMSGTHEKVVFVPNPKPPAKD